MKQQYNYISSWLVFTNLTFVVSFVVGILVVNMINIMFFICTARIQQLESQLSNIQQESSHMQEELNQEVINVRRQTREGEQRDRVELEEKVLTFTRETEALKKEVCSQHPCGLNTPTF